MRVEKWKSNQNRYEQHYYVDGTDIYLFGFNPKCFDEKRVRGFFESEMKKKKAAKKS